MELVGSVQLPGGLCRVCTQDSAALNPKKTLGLRSRFFQAAGSPHLLLGRMKNVAQVLMETRASMRCQGYKEPSAQAALLRLWGAVSQRGTSLPLLLKSAAKLGFTGVEWASEV